MTNKLVYLAIIVAALGTDYVAARKVRAGAASAQFVLVEGMQ